MRALQRKETRLIVQFALHHLLNKSGNASNAHIGFAEIVNLALKKLVQAVGSHFKQARQNEILQWREYFVQTNNMATKW